MPTLRTPLKRKLRGHISQAAVDAWLAGDTRGLQAALGLGPWQHSPLPWAYAYGYGLPDEPDDADASARGWGKCKAYQEQLIALVGLPPISVKRAVAKKRLAEAEESAAYLKTPMARNMAHNKERHEERIRDADDTVLSLRGNLP
jgi:hypothetical protein